MKLLLGLLILAQARPGVTTDHSSNLTNAEFKVKAKLSNETNTEVLVFGDIIMTEEQKIWYTKENPSFRGSITNRFRKWDQVKDRNGMYTVPFRLDRISSRDHQAIYNGMKAIESRTCIRFQERNNERDYIDFFRGQGCYSSLGRTTNRQEISIGNGCAYDDIVSHELMHALGFLHEQSRPDRDQHIQVLYQNMDPSTRSQFEKVSTTSFISYGYGYDINSIMQYDGYAFSRNGQPTIIDLQTDKPIPRNKEISKIDFALINTLYPCKEGIVTPDTSKCKDDNDKCPSWSEFCQENSQYYPYMKENCKKTCKLCNDRCQNAISGCENYESYCNLASIYYPFMKENCKRTCKICI